MCQQRKKNKLEERILNLHFSGGEKHDSRGTLGYMLDVELLDINFIGEMCLQLFPLLFNVTKHNADFNTVGQHLIVCKLTLVWPKQRTHISSAPLTPPPRLTLSCRPPRPSPLHSSNPSLCPTKAISAHAGTRPYGHGWQHGDRGKTDTLCELSITSMNNFNDRLSETSAGAVHMVNLGHWEGSSLNCGTLNPDRWLCPTLFR